MKLNLHVTLTPGWTATTRGPTTTPRGVVVGNAIGSNGGPSPSTPEAGGKLLSLFTQSPLQFGPRLVAGALSTVLEEGISAPQKDLERLQLIVNSDAENKEQQILTEVEDRIAQFVSIGTEKETELLALLPLPEGLRELLGPGDAGASRSSGSKPLATWTITDATDSDNEEIDEYVTPEATASGQAASELSEIQGAVMALRENIEALKTNAEESKVGMLRLNIRDAANTVRQKLDQQQMTSGSSDVNSALMEAKQLLTEVDTL